MPSEIIDIADVLAARNAIGARLHRTPTMSSTTLGGMLGGQVHLKAELFQRTGSFKPRGVLAKLASLKEPDRARGVIGLSSGNHAQALAYCGALEEIDVLVVMWQSASEIKVEATRTYGARVDLEARDVVEAFGRLDLLAKTTGRLLVHPFDDSWIMAGQGTVGLEVVEDVPSVDTVLVPVGGGGLIAGVATAVKALRPDARVIAVEPEGSPTLTRALEAGRVVSTETVSIADGLNSPYTSERCLRVSSRLVDESVLVSDSEIRSAVRFLYRYSKLACEPSGAASVAALLAGKVSVPKGDTAVAIVSGGNVAPQVVARLLDGA